MQLVRRDDFVRADNVALGTATPGPGVWTEQIYGTAGNVDIISNAVGATVANSSAWLSGIVSTANAVGITVKTLPGGVTSMSLYFQIRTPGSAAGDGYDLQFNTAADWQIFRMIDSGFSQVGISNPFQTKAISAGDGIGVQWEVKWDRVVFILLYRTGGHGNEFVPWGLVIEDTNVARLTDPGVIGIEFGDAVGRIDDIYQGYGPVANPTYDGGSTPRYKETTYA